SSFASYRYSIYCALSARNNTFKNATVTEIENQESEFAISPEESTNKLEIKYFNLYPNPAKSFVNIDYLIHPEVKTTIIISDGSGKTMINQTVESVSNRIDLSNLQAGMYFVRSINEDFSVTKKLIIVN